MNTYSKDRDGKDKPLMSNGKRCADFTVSEFACHDGSDQVLVDEALVTILQQIRDHFQVPVTINSGYRTKVYNRSIGSGDGSQHVLGTAADIVVRDVPPLLVAQYAEHLMPSRGGIGLYGDFVHVDVRPARARWDRRGRWEVSVSGWPGYSAPWYRDVMDWVMARGIASGARPEDPATRAEVWAMLRQLYDNM